jgi:hypothetical protein
MWLILIVILVIIVFAGVPVAPWGSWHHTGWGMPSIVGIVLIILVVLLLMGRL